MEQLGPLAVCIVSIAPPYRRLVHLVLERRASTVFVAEAETQVTDEGKAAVLIRR